MEQQTALTVNNLSVSFSMYKRGVRRSDLRVIQSLNLDLRVGEILAVAGSSGSGKSLLAHAILGILPRNAVSSGEMTWFGEVLTQKAKEKLRGRELAFVPQSLEFLDPLMRVEKQIAGERGTVLEARETLNKYGLGGKTGRLYPFQLSGGMARRVLLSAAVVGNASVIIADEPTPGLSLDLAESAMSHFRALANKGAAVLLITHDLDLALRYADRISVFYAGTTVETAPVSDWNAGESSLRHPYSRALWRAMPRNGLKPTPGVQPYAGSLPSGCLFSPRCPFATDNCRTIMPESVKLRGGEVRCFNAS